MEYDWTTFATYANYVRGLFVEPRRVPVAVVDEVLRNKYSQLPLLPNLETLALRYPAQLDACGRFPFSKPTLANIAFARLFLCDSVAELFIYDIPPNSSSLDKNGSYRLFHLTNDIIKRAPNIRSLKLTTSNSPNKRETSCLDYILHALFNGLRNLEKVELSTCLFSSRAISALSRSPRLRIISAAGLVFDMWGRGSQITACASANAYYYSVDTVNAWPQLTQYTAVTGAQQLSSMLQKQTFPSHRLTSLVALLTSEFAHSNETSAIAVQDPNRNHHLDKVEISISNSTVISLLRTISLNCHSLTKLYLDFNVPFGLEDGKSSDGRPFDADDLSVLKHMEHLEELIVRDYRSLCISDDALVSIIGGFLSLKKLALFHIPDWTAVAHMDEEDTVMSVSFIPPRTPSTIQTIFRILEILPSLTHLGIYIDFSIMAPEDVNHHSFPSRKFNSLLEILDLGHSPPPPPSTSEDFLKIFLSGSGAVEIGGAGLYDWGIVRDDMFEHIQDQQEAWEIFI